MRADTPAVSHARLGHAVIVRACRFDILSYVAFRNEEEMVNGYYGLKLLYGLCRYLQPLADRGHGPKKMLCGWIMLLLKTIEGPSSMQPWK